MKFHLIFIIALCSCAATKMNNTDPSSVKPIVAKKLSLPVVLRVEKVTENLKSIFRSQVIGRGIDTIDLREAMRTQGTERSNALRSRGEAAANSFPAKANMLYFEAAGDAESISRISWTGFPMGGSQPDRTIHYCNTPDSLRSKPARAIAACLEEVLKSRVLQ